MNASHVFEPRFETVSENRQFTQTELYAAWKGKNPFQAWFSKGIASVFDRLPLCASPRILSAECIAVEAECEGGYQV